MTVYREFYVFFDTTKPEDFPKIGDKIEIIEFEDGVDTHKGRYLRVVLAPVEESDSE